MAKTETTTTVQYPVQEFIELVRERAFGGKDIKVEFVIMEVGGDPMDRYPGVEQVTQVNIRFSGVPDAN
jgi:hypothetical protein